MRLSRSIHASSHHFSRLWNIFSRCAQGARSLPQFPAKFAADPASLSRYAAGFAQAIASISSHTRTNFDADLSAVRSEVMQMGLLARQAAAEPLWRAATPI